MDPGVAGIAVKVPDKEVVVAEERPPPEIDKSVSYTHLTLPTIE